MIRGEGEVRRRGNWKKIIDRDEDVENDRDEDVENEKKDERTVIINRRDT